MKFSANAYKEPAEEAKTWHYFGDAFRRDGCFSRFRDMQLLWASRRVLECKGYISLPHASYK